MARRHRAADRIGNGTGALVRGVLRWLGPGRFWPALGRLLAAAMLALFAAGLIARAPALMWPAAVGWLAAAWRIGRARPAPAPPAPPSFGERRAAIVAALVEWIGDRRGIHLAEVYERLRERPALAGLNDDQLRAVLAHYEVPVRRAVRVAEAVRTGIHIEDLAPDPSPDATAPTTAPVAPVSSDVAPTFVPVAPVLRASETTPERG